MQSTACAPRFSIITPSFNQGQYLEQTIRSVLEQDYPNIEYIVMDGGSTDDSVAIIRRYADRLSYWTSTRDNGQGDAICRGFLRATGDILAYLNSDDYYLPGALASIAELYRLNPDAAILAGDTVRVRADGQPWAVARARSQSLSSMLYRGFSCGQEAMFWSRRAYDAVGGIDASLHCALDYDLIIRLRRYGTMLATRRYVAAFRSTATQKTAALGERTLQENNAIVSKYTGMGPLGLRIRRLLRRIDLSVRVPNWWAFRRHLSGLRSLCRFGTDLYGRVD